MKSAILSLALVLVSFNAMAGDASNINWHCTGNDGNDLVVVTISNDQATVRSAYRLTAMTPFIVGGPYQNLQTFGGGDFIGVRTADNSDFSLIANSLSYRLNATGAEAHVSNLICH